ncbi:MAG TPA: hypothetical protein VIP11_06830, partial [Gemmatimonadaceae bacterium]
EQRSIADQTPAETPRAAPFWPHWQRVLFRFFVVYLLLQIAPWRWFSAIPGAMYLLRYYGMATDWAVRTANARIFHVRETLIPMNGSGDTSWAYAQMFLYLSLAAAACIVWTVLDRKRTHYERAAFWLRMIVRYYIAAAALSYGIIKLFALQMPFPALSQLATPLGDLLPMRFSWLFIGYSFPYQFFSGAMETLAGLLLLYRRTVTAGLFAATGAFMNVVMINLSYDVPVKLYASHLLFACLFLLALDSKRLVGFLVLNRGAAPTTAYDLEVTGKWQRRGAVAVKAFLVYHLLVVQLFNGWARYRMLKQPANPGLFAAGVYDVRRYVVDRDEIPLSAADSTRWKDVIIDNNAGGSINTKDPVFWQRYGRGYFRYKPNPADQTVAVWKTSTIPRDSTFLFTMRYEVPDSTTIRFHTAIRGDSVHVELVRVPRHFQLTERQFHWLSEYNR